MLIRDADSNDAEAIAACLFAAMEEIVYGFISEKDETVAIDFLLHFIRDSNNQYAYENCMVAVNDNKVVGAINIYDGAKLHTLRQPIINYIHSKFNPNFVAEDETQPGEFYIDTIGVLPTARGKGVGTALLLNAIEEHVHTQKVTLGLLVENENIKAKRLYEKLGFCVVNERQIFGKQMLHLQLRPAL